LFRQRWSTLWCEKEILPWLPAGIEGLLAGRARLLVDLDDAVWLRYAEHTAAWVRWLLGGKIAAVMARADVVIAGNAWLRDQAVAAGSRRVVVLPSVVDSEQYLPVAVSGSPATWNIGWIGSPATVHYLNMLAPCLRRLSAVRPLRLVCVGGGAFAMPGVEVVNRPWTADGEVAEIQRFHIGIMPLADGRWEQGKCGYKLIQCMACGIPVIGSRVGANRDVVNDGVDGLLAGDDGQWFDCFSRLMATPELRQAIAAAGRRKVELHYSRNARVDEFAALLRGDQRLAT
jgi:glycosyltransferase involved in cell wall biosynthesis